MYAANALLEVLLEGFFLVTFTFKLFFFAQINQKRLFNGKCCRLKIKSYAIEMCIDTTKNINTSKQFLVSFPCLQVKLKKKKQFLIIKWPLFERFLTNFRHVRICLFCFFYRGKPSTSICFEWLNGLFKQHMPVINQKQVVGKTSQIDEWVSERWLPGWQAGRLTLSATVVVIWTNAVVFLVIN